MHACASVPKPRLHPNPSPNQGFHDPEGVYSTFLVEYEPDTPRCAMFMGESMNQDNLPSAEYTAVADAVRAAVVARTAPLSGGGVDSRSSPPRSRAWRASASATRQAPRLGSGRVVASELEAPIMLGNTV